MRKWLSYEEDLLKELMTGCIDITACLNTVALKLNRTPKACSLRWDKLKSIKIQTITKNKQDRRHSGIIEILKNIISKDINVEKEFNAKDILVFLDKKDISITLKKLHYALRYLSSRQFIRRTRYAYYKIVITESAIDTDALLKPKRNNIETNKIYIAVQSMLELLDPQQQYEIAKGIFNNIKPV